MVDNGTVKYLATVIVAVSIAACSEGVPFVAEPDDINPPWGPVESTQPPVAVEDLAIVPAPLNEDGIGHLIATYLPDWFGEPALGGEMFCGHELFGWEQHTGVAEAWVWAACSEFYVDVGALVIGTAGSGPMTVHMAETADGWVVSFVDHAEDGGGLEASVRAMFPPEYADRALSDEPTSRDLSAELEHAARSRLTS